MADSLGHLDKKKGRGIDAVTAVRVSADDRETQRRMAEEHARQERLQHLQVQGKRFTYLSHGGMAGDIAVVLQYCTAVVLYACLMYVRRQLVIGKIIYCCTSRSIYVLHEGKAGKRQKLLRINSKEMRRQYSS